MRIHGLYKYNSREERYELVSLAEVIAKVAKYGVAVGFIGFATLAGLSFSGKWDLQAELSRRKLEAQKEKLALLQAETEKISKELNNYYTKYNDFYAEILSLQNINEGVWKAGVGGSRIYPEVRIREIKKLLTEVDKLKFRVKISKRNYEEVSKKIEKVNTYLSELPAGFPTKGRLVSGFGYRKHPLRGGYHLHSGIDIDAPYGTQVKATGDGIVVKAGVSESGYGIQVEIDHGNGFKTKYAHLSKVLVRIGQKVKRGDVIGKVGSTGWSTGPHLHYEVIKGKKKINPYPYLTLGL